MGQLAAYLREHRLARSQFRTGRRLHLSPLPGQLTGCTVLHTAESALDELGPDAGAEGVAAFMTRRTDPGSYHHLVDSDSVIHLVDLGDEAYQDGTGSNPWALSISFALRAADWPRLTPERRAAFLRQGALAFAAQQAWLAARGYPTTPLRRISKVASNQGAAGFITHGDRDPGRRSDPGRDFPWGEWLAACADAIDGEDRDEDMIAIARPKGRPDVWIGDGITRRHIPDPRTLGDVRWLFQQAGTKVMELGEVERISLLGDPVVDTDDTTAILAAIAKQAGVDVDELSGNVVSALVPPVVEALAGRGGASPAEVERVVRDLLGSLGTKAGA